jgi:hypothetical protein
METLADSMELASDVRLALLHRQTSTEVLGLVRYESRAGGIRSISTRRS